MSVACSTRARARIRREGRATQFSSGAEPDMKHWHETQEIVERAVALAADGRRAAIATVVRIEGSSYRRPGARLLIQDDGLTCGGVSGGCLEADVREAALKVIQSGTPRLLHYDTGGDDQTVWGLGLGCNGSVDVFVQAATEASTLAALWEMQTRLAKKSPFVVSTIVDGSDAGHAIVLDARPRDTGSQLTHEGSNLIFIDVFQPPPTLIVCG